MPSSPVNIICMKWGTLYGADYVNKLYHSVKRHLKREFLFHCCTENSHDLDPEIRIIPFPENPGMNRWPDVLAKLTVFRDGFGNLQGTTLFLDLDVVIMRDIDDFFTYKPGEFCMIHNWVSGLRRLTRNRPAVGNSSIFRFEAGKSNHVYETFIREIDRAANLSIFNTEQAFMTYAMKNVSWWPEDWTCSYKRHCKPFFPLNLFTAPSPPNCKILVFHGSPDPEEAIAGFRGRKLHHRIAPAPWIAQFWK